MILFSVSDLCITQDDYGKQKTKILSSNFINDIKFIPFHQCVGKNYIFSNIPQILNTISQLGDFSAKIIVFSEV